MFLVPGEADQLFHLAQRKDGGKGGFFSWPVYLVVFPLSSQHLFVIELDGVDPLVLLAYRDLPRSDQFKDIGIDLVVGDRFQLMVREMIHELLKVKRIGLEGAGAVPFALEQFQISLRQGVLVEAHWWIRLE